MSLPRFPGNPEFQFALARALAENPPPAASCVYSAHRFVDWDSELATDGCVSRRLSAIYLRSGLLQKGTFQHCAPQSRTPDGLILDLESSQCAAEEADRAARELLTEGEEDSSLPRLVLKPSRGNRGEGVRFLNGVGQLRAALDAAWDAEQTKADPRPLEFVVQRFLRPSLTLGGRRFHIRALVVVSGCLRSGAWRVGLHERSLGIVRALDQKNFLTNFCVNGEKLLPLSKTSFSPAEQTGLRDETFLCVKDVFESFAKRPLFFYPLPNQFELFGVDLMLDGSRTLKVLEINSQPSFAMYDRDLAAEICRDLVELQNREIAKVKIPEWMNQEFIPLEESLELELDVWERSGFVKLWESHVIGGGKTMRECMKKFKKRINFAGLFAASGGGKRREADSFEQGGG